MIQEIQRQLAELIAENSRGSTALFEAEKALAEAEYELDLAEQKAYIKASGTVRDREAIAKLESAELRLARDLRKAELGRRADYYYWITTTVRSWTLQQLPGVWH